MHQLINFHETFPCDLRGRHNEELLYTKHGVLTKYPFRVVKCRSCGLIYLNPRLAERKIAELYDGSYYAGRGFDPNLNHIMDFDKENDTDKGFRSEETVRIIKEIFPPPTMLLDFGCGIGDLMRQATKHGYRAEGFEVSQYAADFAIANELEIYTDLGDLPNEKYDVVTAIEVLEHCSSPMETLNTIFKCLKPGGCFYYTTASFDGFYRKWQRGIKDKALDGYILPEGHIHFFSTEVMKSYFNKIGFSQVFSFEPKTYKMGRLYKFLFKHRLINRSGDFPVNFIQKLAYYGTRNLLTFVGLRRRLPLARK